MENIKRFNLSEVLGIMIEAVEQLQISTASKAIAVITAVATTADETEATMDDVKYVIHKYCPGYDGTPDLLKEIRRQFDAIYAAHAAKAS